ncbi:DUF6259 domain-containing protein [Agromyces sp. H66]|uniref:DUF6259 domain-containing protein n=1 Tax=Agromyces sp. H66 TaxID=2529859 RepID=UPI0010AB414A|nr:DUF6259 domain-containing protein [Agromyces sp. H66]
MTGSIDFADEHIRLSFGHQTGVLLALEDAVAGTSFVVEQTLAENWRLLIPLPELRHHYVSGREQLLSSFDVGDGELQLTWHGIRSDVVGDLDIDVTQTWRFARTGVEVVTALRNGSPHQVEEVVSPALGGLGRPDEDEWKLHHPGPLGPGDEFEVFTEFPGTYLGPRNPVWLLPYHTKSGMPWVDVYAKGARRGLYLGIHDPAGAHAVFQLQLFPGPVYRGDRQVWPDPTVLGQETPIGLTAAWSSFPFLTTGGTWTSAPVVLRFHDGTWWSGARIFREWWDEHFDPAPRSWLAEEDAWQSTIISYPDGEIGFRYSDLPALAEDARTAGIRVIQICGWHDGGLDRNYPDYSTDPRLGTSEEFTEALRACEELGVKVLVFGNLQVANLETPEWESLRGYAITDPHGHHYATVGWDYNTTTGIEQLSGYRMAWMNPAHDGFRERWMREMRGILDRHPAGIQLDKVLGGGFFGMDYNPDAPGTPATTLAVGLQSAMEELLEEGRREREDFCLAAESHWDRTPRFANASYARYFTGDHLPTFAAVFPEHRQTCAVTGPHDFGLVNNSLRFGHIISLEPAWMHGSASDVPVTSEYVRRALEFRRGLRGWIWESSLVDPWGWIVEEPDAVSSSAHASWDGRGEALVLNHFETGARTVRIRRRADAGELLTVHRIGLPPEPLTGEVTIAPDEVVVVTAAVPGSDAAARERGTR